LLLRHAAGLLNRVDTLLNVVANEADFTGRNLLIDFERLLDLGARNITAVGGSYGGFSLR
jgi:hypothetical protein